MKVVAQYVLRYVCSAAAVCLVATQVYNSFLKTSDAKHQPGRGVTEPDTTFCRALFTVTDVPHRHAANVSLFIRDLQGYSPPHKLTGDWRARAPPGGGFGSSAAVAGAVRHLLLKRDSPSGVATADYSPLAALLPSVLTRPAGAEGGAPTVTTTTTNNTRIGAAGGLLPFVPCQIAPYADSASVTACFRERLRRNDYLWIFFMGDSKIRNLFIDFVARISEENNFSIKYESGSAPFVMGNIRPRKLKVDMEASSVQLPGVRVSFQFRTFSEQVVSKMKSSAEVRQLQRWAEGLEAPPHLLVLGYSSWGARKTDFQHLHDALGFLMDMHKVVVPVLQKVSQKTRVVVAPQTRIKVTAKQDPLQLYSIPFGDPTFDWSEAVFLHHLRRHTQHRQPPAPQHAQTGKVTNERVGHHDSGTRDHLVPQMADGEVWWWDTSLPLSLAENSECEMLFHSGMTQHPLYTSYFFRCNDDNHAGTVTLGDQVTMLLNLACNSVLGGREGLCCG